jgi:hypothetical protein
MIDIKIKIKKQGENKEEKFLNFAAQQFKKLLKKNLKIPITLYQL